MNYRIDQYHAIFHFPNVSLNILKTSFSFHFFLIKFSFFKNSCLVYLALGHSFFLPTHLSLTSSSILSHLTLASSSLPSHLSLVRSSLPSHLSVVSSSLPAHLSLVSWSLTSHSSGHLSPLSSHSPATSDRAQEALQRPIGVWWSASFSAEMTSDRIPFN